MPRAVPWVEVAAFAAGTVGLMWLLCLPFHLGLAEVRSVWFGAALISAMYIPAIVTAALVMWRDRGRGWWRRLGLGAPSWRRALAVGAFALVVPPILSYGSLFVGAALGWYELDLSFSGYRALVRAQIEAGGGDPEPMLALLTPPLIVISLVVNPLVGGLINVIATFGEEIGWRGWLLPRLMPLGAWPAMLLSGALWGLWHAPVILLGYNYPSAPQLGVLLFVGFCAIWGVLHGWTRIATGSVWPAAVMHGAVNASGGAFVLLAAEGYAPDTVWVGLVGLSGWILPALLIGGLALAGALPGRWREPGWEISAP
jgi:uncharacterized protein